MNFSELKQEIQDRGFDFLSDARLGTFVNRAYQRVNESRPWPYLETSLTSQNAPITFTDLRQVLYVIDTTNKHVLRGEDQRIIRQFDPDLEVSGNPEFYYLEGDVMKVWPPNASTNLDIRYVKVPTDLTGTDEPVFPSRFHYMIVEGALVIAYRDTDNLEAAENHEARFQYELLEMSDSLLSRQLSGHQFVQSSGFFDDFNR